MARDQHDAEARQRPAAPADGRPVLRVRAADRVVDVRRVRRSPGDAEHERAVRAPRREATDRLRGGAVEADDDRAAASPSGGRRTNGTSWIRAKPSDGSGSSSSRRWRKSACGASTDGSFRAAAFISSGSSRRPWRSTIRATAFTCASSSDVRRWTQRTGTPCAQAVSTTALRAARAPYVLSSTTRRRPAARCASSAGSEVRERAAGLVAVEPLVPARDQVARERALAGRGQAHHEHDVAVGVVRRAALRARDAQEPRGGEARVERRPVAVRQRDAARRATARVSGRVGPGSGVTTGESRRATPARPPRRTRRDAARPPRPPGSRASRARLRGPAERTVREQADAVLRAVLGDAAAEARVVPRATARPARTRPRRASRASRSCATRDVAEPDVLDEPVALERRQRAHAGRERDRRVGRVELVQEDAVDAERRAGSPRRPRAGGGRARPAPSGRPGATSPPFVATRTRRRVAAPGCEGARDQALVVPGLGRVAAVRVRGVEQA